MDDDFLSLVLEDEDLPDQATPPEVNPPDFIRELIVGDDEDEVEVEFNPDREVDTDPEVEEEDWDLQFGESTAKVKVHHEEMRGQKFPEGGAGRLDAVVDPESERPWERINWWEKARSNMDREFDTIQPTALEVERIRQAKDPESAANQFDYVMEQEDWDKFLEEFQPTSEFFRVEEAAEAKRKAYLRPKPAVTDPRGVPSYLPQENIEVRGDTIPDTVSSEEWAKQVVGRREQFQVDRFGEAYLKDRVATFNGVPRFTENKGAAARRERARLRKMEGSAHFVAKKADRVNEADWEKDRESRVKARKAQLKLRDRFEGESRTQEAYTEGEVAFALQNSGMWTPTTKQLELLKWEKGDLELDDILGTVVAESENQIQLRHRAYHARDLLLQKGVLPLLADTRSVSAAEEVMDFLARFKWSTTKTLSRLTKKSMKSTEQVLLALVGMGVVTYSQLVGLGRAWHLTPAGREVEKEKGIACYGVIRGVQDISYSLIPHQTVVNHIAARLLSGFNMDTLGLSKYGPYPQKNRTNFYGTPVYGETLVAEVEIQSALARHFDFGPAGDFRKAHEGVDWKRPGRVTPEFENPALWALLPPPELTKVYHVPDLVINRPRDEEGNPHAIAVEVEIGLKLRTSIADIMRTYKYDLANKYERVVWVARNKTIARRLESCAKWVGLWQLGTMEIVPLMTDKGILDKGHATWMI